MLFGFDQEGSTLFQFYLNVWLRNCWRQFLEIRSSFRKSFFHWCLIYVQLLSNVVLVIAQDFASNAELLAQDYIHFCCNLREVRHFERLQVWSSVRVTLLFYNMVLSSPRLVQQMIDLTLIAFFLANLQKMHHFQCFAFRSCWTCGQIFSNMVSRFRLVGQLYRQS